MNALEVERLGGFGGFGLPGSHLRSHGRLAWDGLSAADQHAIDTLFARAPSAATPAPAPDGFRYRLTRVTPAGSRTIEAPEQHVPAAVRNCVRDELV